MQTKFRIVLVSVIAFFAVSLCVANYLCQREASAAVTTRTIQTEQAEKAKSSNLFFKRAKYDMDSPIQYPVNPDYVQPLRYHPDVPLSMTLQLVLFTTAEEYGLDPALILGIIQTESSFKENCVSSVGCYGLMQLHPKYHGAGLSSADNIRVGIAEIARLVSKYKGNVHMALVAYNCGEGGAQSKYFSNGVYSSAYSKKVMSRASYWAGVLDS